MKKIKFVSIILCLSAVMVIGIIAVNAGVNEIPLYVSSNIQVEQAADINKDINKDISRVNSLLNNAEETYIDENGEVIFGGTGNTAQRYKKSSFLPTAELSTEKTFKMFGVNNDDVVDAYYSAECLFSDNISEDYSLNIPVTEDGKIISLVEKRRVRGVDELDFSGIQDEQEKNEMMEYAQNNGGKYVTSIVGLYMPVEAADLFSNTQKVNELIASCNLNDIVTVKYVTLSNNGIDIIYIQTTNGEFAIPFSKNISVTGLNNGKLYSMQDFINTLANK